MGQGLLDRIDNYIDIHGPVTFKEEEGRWLILADREPGLVMATCENRGEAVRFVMAHVLPFSFWRTK